MSEAAEAAPPRSKDEDEGSSATGSVARRPRRRDAWTGEVGGMYEHDGARIMLHGLKAWALDDGLVLHMPLFKAVCKTGVA